VTGAFRDRKVAAETMGRRAEGLAAAYLRLKGYRILGRRIARPPIEIDILARRGDLLVLVEVKYRQTLDLAVLALTPSALKRLMRAADQLAREAAWAAQGSQRPGRPGSSGAVHARVDMIALAPWRWPRHIENLHP
jgi:putative endonuclease